MADHDADDVPRTPGSPATAGRGLLVEEALLVTILTDRRRCRASRSCTNAQFSFTTNVVVAGPDPDGEPPITSRTRTRTAPSRPTRSTTTLLTPLAPYSAQGVRILGGSNVFIYGAGL